jgi:alkylation response protein AidB-like acyl-CoA dehydrogenase
LNGRSIADETTEWQVLAEHCRQGYMAAAIYPMPANYLNGIRLPANIAADEWDGFHDLIVLDEVARCGYLGVIWGLACGNSIGAPPLINFGNEEQKQRFLPRILNGSIRFCLAVTEPDGE